MFVKSCLSHEHLRSTAQNGAILMGIGGIDTTYLTHTLPLASSEPDLDRVQSLFPVGVRVCGLIFTKTNSPLVKSVAQKSNSPLILIEVGDQGFSCQFGVWFRFHF